MSTRSKFLIYSAAVLCVAGGILIWQRLEIGRLNGQIASLAKQKRTVQGQTETKAVIQNASDQSGLDDEHASVRIKMADLKFFFPAVSDEGVVSFDSKGMGSLSFIQPLNGNFEVSQGLAILLSMSDEETGRLNNTLANLKNDVEAHNRSSAIVLDPAEITDSQVLSFLQRNPGQVSAFTIMPFSKDDQSTILDGFSENAQNILGADRSELFLKATKGMLMQRVTTRTGTIAFSDSTDVSGKAKTIYMLKTGSNYSSGPSDKPIPKEFNYLLEENNGTRSIIKP